MLTALRPHTLSDPRSLPWFCKHPTVQADSPSYRTAVLRPFHAPLLRPTVPHAEGQQIERPADVCAKAIWEEGKKRSANPVFMLWVDYRKWPYCTTHACNRDVLVACSLPTLLMTRAGGWDNGTERSREKDRKKIEVVFNPHSSCVTTWEARYFSTMSRSTRPFRR